MSREKQLLKNTGIIAIGQLSSKIFSFLLLPLYTRALLPDDYGTVDVIQTVISLAMYFVTLQLESAIFRFLIENRENEKKRIQIISTASIIVLINSAIFTFIAIIISVFNTIPYFSYFLFSFWGVVLSTLMLNIARGVGENALYSLASFLMTTISLVMNIVLIIGFDFGAGSILLSIALSNVLAFLVVMFRIKLWTVIRWKSFSRKLCSDMLSYSIPLIPNAISWWIANTSDRFVILTMLGSTFNGIYAAANKIPTIYTTVFNVYNMAWNESVALCMNDSDKETYMNKVYNDSIRFFSSVALGIIICISFVFELVVGENYSDAYVHVLILVIAIFINSLCSMLGGVLSGYKDSVALGVSTVCGAVANIIINLALVHIIGLYAASISTLLSYLLIYFIRKIYVRKHAELRIDCNFFVQFVCLLIIEGVVYLYRSRLLCTVMLIIIVLWGGYHNKEIIRNIMEGGRNAKKIFKKN